MNAKQRRNIVRKMKPIYRQLAQGMQMAADLVLTDREEARKQLQEVANELFIMGGNTK